MAGVSMAGQLNCEVVRGPELIYITGPVDGDRVLSSAPPRMARDADGANRVDQRQCMFFYDLAEVWPKTHRNIGEVPRNRPPNDERGIAARFERRDTTRNEER